MVNRDNMKLIHELREQGIDWETIHETVGSNDVDRKAYYGFQMGLEEQSDDDLIKHAKTLQRIRKQKKMLGVERSINNEEIRDIALHQTFTKQVIDAIENRYSGFNITYTPNKVYDNKHHIFSVADFHYNGDISTLDVIKRATGEIIKVIEEKGLTEIYLIELGDTIDGATLRNSQLMAIKKGMVDQVLDVVDAYIKMIVKLSEYVNVKFISVDSSNHTQIRNLGTKQNGLIEEDFMKVFNKFIELALPNLDFVHDKELFIDIGGFTFFIAHGHEAKGNALAYIKAVSTHRNKLIDYTLFGHRHHLEVVDINSAGHYDKQLLFSPALTTQLSQYEKQNNMSSMEAVGYFVISEDKGLVECRKLIV